MESGVEKTKLSQQSGVKKKSLMEECEEAGNYEKADMFRVENRGKRLAKRKKKGEFWWYSKEFALTPKKSLDQRRDEVRSVL